MSERTEELLETAITSGRWADWTIALRAIRIERGQITPWVSDERLNRR